MFLKSKGYLLIESMVSLTIFIIAISLGNVVILRVFKYNTFENFEKIEVSYIFLDNLYRKIKMLDNDSNIEVKGDNVLILKEKEIKTKYGLNILFFNFKKYHLSLFYKVNFKILKLYFFYIKF